MKDIAICAIGYKRPDSMARLLESLGRACYPTGLQVTLYVSIDHSDSDAVGQLADEFQWPYGPKQVIRRPENMGLRRHVLACGDLIEGHDAMVVLEDDVFVAPGFYDYAQQCVERFAADDSVAGISLYNFAVVPGRQVPFHPLRAEADVYLMQWAQSWGQVWLRERWREFRRWYDAHSEEFGEMPHLPQFVCGWPKSSWLKYHIRYCMEQGKYFVYPYSAFSTNFSDCGTHVNRSNTYYQAFLHQGTPGPLRLNPTVRYDGFFEPLDVAQWLGLPAEELSVDFLGVNGNRQRRRYWLTRQRLPYARLRSWAMRLKPWELNVFYGIDGEEIFLYDTTISAAPPKVKQSILQINYSKYMYMYRIDLPGAIWHSLLSIKKRLKSIL